MAKDVIRLSQKVKDNLEEYRSILVKHAEDCDLPVLSKSLLDSSYSDLIELSVTDALIFTKRLKKELESSGDNKEEYK